MVYLGSYEKGRFPPVCLDGQSWGAGGSLKSAALQKDKKEGEKHQYFVLLLAQRPPYPERGTHTGSTALMFVQGTKKGRNWMERT